MIRKLPESDGSTLGVEVSGKIDLKQQRHWKKILDKLIEEYNDINVLVVLDGKINVGADVTYADLQWLFNHLKNLNKLAIVSESKTLRWLVAADRPFGKLAGISEKHFELSKLPEAWNWVKEQRA